MGVRVGGIEFSIRVNAVAAVRAVKQFQGQLRQGGAAAKKANGQIKALQTQLGFLTAGFGAVAVASGLAAKSVLSFAKSSTLLAARVEVLGTVFRTVGQNTGFTVAQLDAVEDSVKRLGITTRAARRSLTQLLQANLDLARATDLTRVAQDAAVIAGVDSSEAFNRLVVSIQRNDVRLLRNLGIVINLNTVYQKFAATTGRTVNTMTAFEKRQLLLNEVLKRGADISGSYEAALGDVFKRFTSLTRKVEEARREFGENLIPIFETLVDTTDDLLDEFTAGEGGLQAFTVAAAASVVAFAALATTATAATGTFAAGVAAWVALSGAAAAAGITLAAVTAPIVAVAAVAAGLAAAGTAVAGAFAFAEASVTEFAEAVAEAEVQGKKLGQNLADLQASFQRLEGLEASGKKNDNVLRAIRLEAEELSKLLPDVEDHIRRIAEGGDAGRLRKFVESQDPRAALGREQTLIDIRKKQEEATNKARDAIVSMGVSVADADKMIVRSIASGNGLADVFDRLEDPDPLVNFLPESFRKLSLSFRESGAAVLEATDAYAKASGQLTAVSEAADAANLQKFNDALDAARKSASQATKALGQLQTVRKKGFSDNEKGLAKFLELQRKVSASNLIAVASVKNRANLEIEQARRLSGERLKTALEAAKRETFAAKRNAAIRGASFKERKKLAGKIRNIHTQQADDLKELAKVEEFFAETVALSNEELENSVRALDAREERLKFLEQGLDAGILRLQERRTLSHEEHLASERRLTTDLVAAFEQRNALVTELETEVAKGSKTRAEAENNSGLKRIEEEIDAIHKAREVARRTTILSDKELQLSIEKERKQAFDSLFKQEEDALNKLAKLRGEVNTNSLDQVTEAADKQKRALKQADDFLAKISQTLRNKTTPGLRSVEAGFTDFSEALGNATTQAQVDSLAELFPKEIARRIEDATKNLDKTRESFRKFTEETRPKTERDDRIERQKEYNRLIDAGVPQAVAQRERDKKRVADAAILNTKEAKLLKEKEEQEKIARTLKKEEEAKAKLFKDNADVRRTALKETVSFEERRLELVKEQTSEIERQVGVIQNQRSALAARTKVADPGGPGEFTARAPNVVQKDTEKEFAKDPEGFRNELTRLREAEERGLSAQEELTTELIDLVRQAGENRELNTSAITQVLKQIRRDKKVGDQSLAGSKRL